MDPDPNSPHAKLALQFAEALVGERFDDAHAMLTSRLREQMSPDDLRTHFQEMMYSPGPIVVEGVMAAMQDWPDREPGDVGWAYVSIAGDGYGEAVTVIVMQENAALKIRDIEWGSP